MLISASSITKFHNEKCILNDVSFTIEENDKIALIGINGTGKSTFLKIIAGIEDYEGNIIRKNGLRISYLAQDDDFEESESILEAVRSRVEKCEEYEIRSILTKLKVKDVDSNILQISGGEKKRVALAIALLKPCDLLILDEPTNHLDNDMIEWLEKYLIKMSHALLMVTHDRYFLERITKKIFEIDRTKIYGYEANYSNFLALKEMREQQALANERKREAFLRKELEWIRSNAQARSTKSKERIARFEKLSSVEKIGNVEKVNLLKTSSRLGKKIMEIDHLSAEVEGRVLFSDFSYVMKRNDRIGIVGDNGCGKSTLLNILVGNVQPTSGEVIIGKTVRIGYFKQGCDDLDDRMIVYDVIKEVSDDLKTSEGHLSAKAMLERFLFDSHLQHTRVGYLSGGEKRRLYLLKVLMSAPNVLLLDEPTNDLDLQTLTILEDYLDEFDGAVLTVSHDRYFLDRCCDYVMAYEEGAIHLYVGGYSDYYEQKIKVAPVKEKINYQEMKKTQMVNQIRLTSKEKKELENMESVLLELESKISMIDEEMNTLDDFQRISELSIQRSELEELLEAKNERWMELLEKEEAVRMNKK